MNSLLATSLVLLLSLGVCKLNDLLLMVLFCIFASKVLAAAKMRSCSIILTAALR